MVILVVYDIGESKDRRRVDAVCRDHGLVRVQGSVFRGRIDARRRDRLVEALMAERPKNGEDTWDVQLYVMGDDDYAGHLRLNWRGLRKDDDAHELGPVLIV